MSKPTTQNHIDAAGRLAGIMNDLSDDTITQLDVLQWCVETNTLLGNDVHTPRAALGQVNEWAAIIEGR